MKKEMKELKMFYKLLVERLKVDGCVVSRPAKVLQSVSEDVLTCITGIEILETEFQAIRDTFDGREEYIKHLEKEVEDLKAKKRFWKGLYADTLDIQQVIEKRVLRHGLKQFQEKTEKLEKVIRLLSETTNKSIGAMAGYYVANKKLRAVCNVVKELNFYYLLKHLSLQIDYSEIKLNNYTIRCIEKLQQALKILEEK